MRHRYMIALAAICVVALLPTLARANARLVSVTPVDGGCIAGPTGSHVEAWDVQSLKTYTFTLDNVLDCANGGTDATINVVVQDSVGLNVDLVAAQVSTGVYTFQFTIPANYCLTARILYCTSPREPGAGLVVASPGDPFGGFVVGRHDTGLYESHLRISIWGADCTNPVEYSCATPALPKSWGMLKSIYR